MVDYSTIIVAAITGIFSILAILLQKRNNKFNDQVNTQNDFIKKTRDGEKKILESRELIDRLTKRILIVILDTNIYILQDMHDEKIINDIAQKSIELKQELLNNCSELDNLNKEQNMRKELESMMQEELHKNDNNDKK